MSYADFDAVLARCREVLDSGAGALRAIASTRFDGGNYEGLNDEAKARRALDTPIFEVRVTDIKRHPSSPPSLGSIALYAFEIQVAVVRYLGLKHKLTSSTRDDQMSLAQQDGDVIAQAFGVPGNLTTTSGGTATGIVSGLLRYEGSNAGRLELRDEGNSLIETTHRFSGVLNVSQAPISIAQFSDITSCVADYRGAGLTNSGGFVTDWVDSVSGFNLTQASGTLQPAYTAADTNFNSQPSATWDGSNDLLKAATASDWSFLHNGTGMTIAFVARHATGSSSRLYLFDTSGDGTRPGIYLRSRSSNGRLEITIYNASTTIVNDEPFNGMTANAAHLIVLQYSAPTYRLLVDNSVIVTGTQQASPTTNAPSQPLCLGRANGGGSPFLGSMARVAAWNRYLADDELHQLTLLSRSTYGTP